MKKFPLLLGMATIATISSPAFAQDRAGDIQVKVLATAVLPDGAINEVVVDNFGLPAGSDTEANTNFVPTLAVEYFLTDTFSIETIAGTTQHDVDAVSGLPAGSELVSDALLLPATVTAKAHFDLGGIKPYVGAGAAYFIWLDSEPGVDAAVLGITGAELSDELGFVLQAGVDVPLNEGGLGLTLDAKRYFIGTTAQFSVNDTVVIETDHRLDPWVLSAGISYRF